MCTFCTQTKQAVQNLNDNNHPVLNRLFFITLNMSRLYSH